MHNGHNGEEFIDSTAPAWQQARTPDPCSWLGAAPSGARALKQQLFLTEGVSCPSCRVCPCNRLTTTLWTCSWSLVAVTCPCRITDSLSSKTTMFGKWWHYFEEGTAGSTWSSNISTVWVPSWWTLGGAQDPAWGWKPLAGRDQQCENKLDSSAAPPPHKVGITCSKPITWVKSWRAQLLPPPNAP